MLILLSKVNFAYFIRVKSIKKIAQFSLSVVTCIWRNVFFEVIEPYNDEALLGANLRIYVVSVDIK